MLYNFVIHEATAPIVGTLIALTLGYIVGHKHGYRNAARFFGRVVRAIEPYEKPAVITLRGVPSAPGDTDGERPTIH